MEPLPQTGKLQGRFDKGYKLPGAQRGDHCLKVTFFLFIGSNITSVMKHESQFLEGKMTLTVSHLPTSLWALGSGPWRQQFIPQRGSCDFGFEME